MPADITPIDIRARPPFAGQVRPVGVDPRAARGGCADARVIATEHAPVETRLHELGVAIRPDRVAIAGRCIGLHEHAVQVHQRPARSILGREQRTLRRVGEQAGHPGGHVELGPFADPPELAGCPVEGEVDRLCGTPISSQPTAVSRSRRSPADRAQWPHAEDGNRADHVTRLAGWVDGDIHTFHLRSHTEVRPQLDVGLRHCVAS